MGVPVLAAAATAVAAVLAASTAPAAEDTAGGFSFAVFADAQYCDCDPKGTRRYRDSLDKLADGAETFNAREVAFTIQLGDLIDRYYESFGPILSVYDDVDGPRHHVLGNHDFPVSREQVLQRLGMRRGHYQFSLGGWRFVVLDTNDISLYANPEGSPKHERAEQILARLSEQGAPNARSYNGAVGRRQMTWLESVLSDAAEAAQPVVVFGHMPIHELGVHTAWNHRAIRRALAGGGTVVAYLNGHDHDGDYALRDGIHYLNLRGMVEGTTNAYAILHLEPGRVRVEGFGREPDRVLDLPG